MALVKGHLVIIGGGGKSDDLIRRFVDLAGKSSARLVSIPTALEDAELAGDNAPEYLKQGGAKDITTLHTRDPHKADTEAFVRPLTRATGVWLGGGRQWRVADAYLNTRTLREMNALLERGGVIGGSSAGATIQGSFLVRGDTRGNQVMEGDHVAGFGFLPDVAIDQHVLRRNRQFDLIPVVRNHPELLGIGIDEDTAIFVHGDRFEVAGAGYVAIHDARLARQGRFDLLSPGERFDLRTRRRV